MQFYRPFGIMNLDPETVRKAIRDTEPGFHVSTIAMSLYVETTTD